MCWWPKRRHDLRLTQWKEEEMMQTSTPESFASSPKAVLYASAHLSNAHCRAKIKYVLFQIHVLFLLLFLFCRVWCLYVFLHICVETTLWILKDLAVSWLLWGIDRRWVDVYFISSSDVTLCGWLGAKHQLTLVSVLSCVLLYYVVSLKHVLFKNTYRKYENTVSLSIKEVKRA